MDEEKDKHIIEVHIASNKISGNTPIEDYFNQIHDEPLVSKKKHVPFVYAIAMLLVTSLTVMGISSLSSILSSLTSQITSALYSFSGLPYGIGDLLIGIMALGLAAILLVWANRGREVSEKISDATSIMMDNEPDEYFDFGTVDAKFMMKEFNDRGCLFELNEGGGFTMECPEYPVTEKMREIIQGIPQKWNKRQKIIQFTILNLIVIISMIFMQLSSQNVSSADITEETLEVQSLHASTGQWIFIIIMYFCMGLLVEFRTVPSWVVGCVLIPTYTISVKFVVTDFPEMTWWVLVIVACCIVILTLVLYGLKPYLCSEKDTWWCDIL